MKFIVGTKEKMTQIFSETGEVTPVTLISASPVVVTHIRSAEKDGYSALQVGYGSKNPKKIGKAMKGHTKDLGSFRGLKEFRMNEVKNALGDKIDVSAFTEGDTVRVTAVSKGKGFQGVVKRHGFKGGSRTHGQKHSEREPGAIGGGGGRAGGRVAKGIRMAGRMGGDRVTVKNLTVVKIDKEGNALYIKGAVPGRKGTLVEVIG